MRDERTRALQREATARWRALNPEKVREKKCRAHSRMSKEKQEKERRRLRQWAQNNREKERVRGWRKQGLPDPSRPRPDNCELCERSANFETRGLALDHDHGTGTFRGWLCGQCNTALGLLGDSIEGVEKAAAYLKRVSLGS